jgi:YVTN family beta-propeller protein
MKFRSLKLAVIGMAAFAGAALAAPGTVYVADEGSDTVSVLDAASFKRVAAIAVGRQPHNVQVSPDGKLAWVTNNGESRKAERGHAGMSKDEHVTNIYANTVSVLDVRSAKVVATVPVGRAPNGISVTP